MSRVIRKFQITIPVSVRKAIGIVPGSEVDIVPKGKDYVLKVDPVEQRIGSHLHYSIILHSLSGIFYLFLSRFI